MAINIDNLEKAGELLKDKVFLQNFIACETADAVIALFAQKGVTVTAEEIKALGELLQSAKDDDGELPDEIAEQVAGGADAKKGKLDNLKSIFSIMSELLDGVTSPLNKIFKLFNIDVQL